MAREIYLAVKAIAERTVIKDSNRYFCQGENGQLISMDDLREVLGPITGVRSQRYPQDDFIAPGYMTNLIQQRLALYENFLVENPDTKDDLNVVFDRWVASEAERMESIIRERQYSLVEANPCLQGVEWRKAVHVGNVAVQREIWLDGNFVAMADTSEKAAQKAVHALATRKPVWCRTFDEFKLGVVAFPVVEVTKKKRAVVDNSVESGDPDSLWRVQSALKECMGEHAGQALSEILKTGLSGADVKFYTVHGGDRGPVFLMHRSGATLTDHLLREMWSSEVMEAMDQGKAVPSVVRQALGLPVVVQPAQKAALSGPSI